MAVGDCPSAVAGVDLGVTRYAEALVWQRQARERRMAGLAPDTLLLTEHLPVITLGSGADGRHLLVREAALTARGIDVMRVERGGDVTYHGPGQLVAYPVLDLHGFGRDIHLHMRRLEETAIRLLAAYGVSGERRPGTAGVWVGACKIAAVGVHVRRWVTLHGVAINITPDLAPFDLINPCGLVGMRMTSVQLETGRAPAMADVKQRYAEVFAGVFGCRVVAASEAPYGFQR